MRAVLSSKIEVSRIAMFAEMAWLERRPELGLLCRKALEQGRRVSVATVQAALPGLPDAGARNVLAWCRMLGLCDAHGGLTALGEEVAERDEAPVPEQGVYCLWLAQHPLLGRRVLAAERLASSRDGRFNEIQPLPVQPEQGKVFRSVLSAKEQFLVRSLPTQHGQSGCLLYSTQATCRVRWTLDFDAGRDQWQLEGAIEVHQGQGKYALQPMQHEPEREGLDLWNLANIWGLGPLAPLGRWQPDERRLAVAFHDLAEGEQDTFRKTLKLPRVEVPGKGTYHDVTLEDVPIGPMSNGDAQQWALSRFERRLTKHPGYRSRAAVRELFTELTEGTPLERCSPTLPAHEDLLGPQEREPPRDPGRFWSLAAPVDLAPHPVPREELDALRIGSPAPTPAVELPNIVRIPYRGGWSMRRLMERLLAGMTPRKVLLCDRYVRGAENMVVLRLFVQAVRAVAPATVMEVWTDEEAADFKQIQAVTGTAPRGYREMFGRNFPHDRYLLLLPAQGAGFAWHLSNSPLHARPDVPNAGPDSPLKWKDLAGTRVSADELEPALRRWIDGGER